MTESEQPHAKGLCTRGERLDAWSIVLGLPEVAGGSGSPESCSGALMILNRSLVVSRLQDEWYSQRLEGGELGSL